ncbi:recombinase family protein [Paenibacillus sp. FSL H3-0333]
MEKFNTTNGPQKKLVTGTHEAIITEELWKQVQH